MEAVGAASAKLLPDENPEDEEAAPAASREEDASRKKRKSFWRRESRPEAETPEQAPGPSYFFHRKQSTKSNRCSACLNKNGHSVPCPHGVQPTDNSPNLQLSRRQKLHEFYAAPVTKFWGHAVGFLVFLYIYTFVVLVRMYPQPSGFECYVIAYIFTFACEKFRELLYMEPRRFSHKLAMWLDNKWNICDTMAISFFMLGVIVRFWVSLPIGRVFYCVDIMYWYIRILDFLSVNKYLGPFVTMIGRMLMNMLYFVVLLGVTLMSFGVARQAILYPYEDPNWKLAREIFFQPYFMLYGEVFAGDIDPPCGEGTDLECQPGRWITPIAMSVYLLVANILLINLLIAVFNHIFEETNSVARQLWMFQRFSVVMEYEQKPFFPPPLIVISHIYLIIYLIRRRMKRVESRLGYGLKLFLDRHGMERIHDFEEECMDGYFDEQMLKENQQIGERVRSTCDKVEHISQRVVDLGHKRNADIAVVQAIEARIARIEQTQDRMLEILVASLGSQRPSMERKSPESEAGEGGPRTRQDSFQGSVASRQSSRSDRPGTREDPPGRGGGQAPDPRPPEEPPQNVVTFELPKEAPPLYVTTVFNPADAIRARAHSVVRRRAGSLGVRRPSLSRDDFAGGLEPPFFTRLAPMPSPSAKVVAWKKSVQTPTEGVVSYLPPPKSSAEEEPLKEEESVFDRSPQGVEDRQAGDTEEEEAWKSLNRPQGAEGDEFMSYGYPADPFSLAFERSSLTPPQHRPMIQVIPPTPPVFVPPKIQEYTSITDDLETAVYRLGRPRSKEKAITRTRQLSESGPSGPPGVLEVEEEVLREAESSHYHMMGTVIKRRLRNLSECTPNDETSSASKLDNSNDSEDDEDEDDDVTGGGDKKLKMFLSTDVAALLRTRKLGAVPRVNGRYSFQNLPEAIIEVEDEIAQQISSVSMPSLPEAARLFK